MSGCITARRSLFRSGLGGPGALDAYRRARSLLSCPSSGRQGRSRRTKSITKRRLSVQTQASSLQTGFSPEGSAWSRSCCDLCKQTLSLVSGGAGSLSSYGQNAMLCVCPHRQVHYSPEPAPTPPAPPAGPASSPVVVVGEGLPTESSSSSSSCLPSGARWRGGPGSRLCSLTRSSPSQSRRGFSAWDLPWDRQGKLPGLFPELAVTRPRGRAWCWAATCGQEGAVLRSRHLPLGARATWGSCAMEPRGRRDGPRLSHRQLLPTCFFVFF